MTMKRVVLMVLAVSILMCLTAVVLPGQGSGPAANSSSTFLDDILKYLLGMVGGSVLLGLFLYLKRKKIEADKREAVIKVDEAQDVKKQLQVSTTAEDIYCNALREELGNIHALGSPDFETRPLTLDDVFVSLRISEGWRTDRDRRYDGNTQEMLSEMERVSSQSPEKVMTRAFQKKNRLLLIIGDPGSGKTTLLKYYAMCCLDLDKRRFRALGFNSSVMPLYFPLRELDFANDKQSVSLHEVLARWAERHHLDIDKDTFYNWLHKRKTLVLLDGLDEVSSITQRKKVCQWISDIHNGLTRAKFVLTSRATGYRTKDGIQLKPLHLRADVLDFSTEQQDEFLVNWFRAVYLHGMPPVDADETQWREKQTKAAAERSRKIIEFLKQKESAAVRQLASVPMLLGLVAVIWNDRNFRPRSRRALYDAALNYLLDHRDQQKDIEPFIPADEARRVLAPAALWMQEKLEHDAAPKAEMHATMQGVLDTLAGEPQAEAFCIRLRDRAGLISDDVKDHYVFRHKSFREFLAAEELLKHSTNKTRIKSLVSQFNNDWWEETIRFFMSKVDDQAFDLFMRLFFDSKASEGLDPYHQAMLMNLVSEAPQRKIDSLVKHLNRDGLNERQRLCVLDCLNIIGKASGFDAIEEVNKTKWSERNRERADEIVRQSKPFSIQTDEPKIINPEAVLNNDSDSWFNPFEGNVEYIKIPGGSYTYSVSKQTETVTDIHFCKYQVTNQRYGRFIDYLSGNLKQYEDQLPINAYAERLREFAESIDGYTKYLEGGPGKWSALFRSEENENKKFNGDEQPVVSVSWYAARAYCLWLSCLEPGSVYRLPTEIEWEWAAGGKNDGTVSLVRKYPWPDEKGEPTPELANFGKNVGATTPVGLYPDGATPTGLMDMPGNVWEWMENYYNEDRKSTQALRGGSWFSMTSFLRCSNRYCFPGNQWNVHGFRVVRAQA